MSGNSKSSPMYDLEERTKKFALNVRKYIKSMDRNIINYGDCKQVCRSSGSIGANYIEANEKLGPKDFVFRLKIARKEAKETGYWLQILQQANDLQGDHNLHKLIDECGQLRKILSSIINKQSMK